MGLRVEDGGTVDRPDVVVILEGLVLPDGFELREEEDGRILYHNPCGQALGRFSLHGTPASVRQVIEEHEWCPAQGRGVGGG